MGQYSDSMLNLHRHRLCLFESGYQFAAMLNLIDRNPLEITYQYRYAASRILEALRLHPNQSLSVLWKAKRFDTLPLFVSAMSPQRNNAGYFLGQEVSSFKMNRLVEDLSFTVRNRIDNNLTALKDAMLCRQGHGIIALEVDDLKLARLWLNKFQEKNVFDSLTVYVFNYCHEKQVSYYFELKNCGFQMIEHCSGLGELRI